MTGQTDQCGSCGWAQGDGVGLLGPSFFPGSVPSRPTSAPGPQPCFSSPVRPGAYSDGPVCHAWHFDALAGKSLSSWSHILPIWQAISSGELRGCGQRLAGLGKSSGDSLSREVEGKGAVWPPEGQSPNWGCK